MANPSDEAMNTLYRRPMANELNADIWEEIFKMIELDDQFSLALALECCYNTFADMICPHLRMPLNLKHIVNLNWAGKARLLEALGEHMTVLEVPAELCNWRSWRHAALQRLINKKLRKISRLRVERQRPLVAVNYCCALKVDCITELELYDCNLCDRNIKLLPVMCNLKALGLGRNRRITGKYIDLLEPLDQLSIYKCSRVTATDLHCIFLKHTLSYLDMRLVVNTALTWPLLRQLTTIEHLKADVRLCPFPRQRPQVFDALTHLTALELDSRLFGGSTAHTIKCIVEHVNKGLEELRLTALHDRMSEELMHAISELHELRVLHLNNYHVDLELRWCFERGVVALDKLEELAYHQPINGINIMLPIMTRLSSLIRLSLSTESGFLLSDFTELIDALKERAKEQTIVKPLVLNMKGPKLPRRLQVESICKAAPHLLRLTINECLQSHGTLHDKNNDNDSKMAAGKKI